MKDYLVIVCLTVLLGVLDVHALVRTPPLITGEANQTIAYKIGESLELRCTASGVPAPSYRWMKDGREFDVSGNDNRVTQQPNVGTIVINQPLKKDEGTYQCFAENQAGTAVTQKTILRSSQLDEFAPVVRPREHRVEIGDPLTLPCSPPKSIPRAEVFWTKSLADGAAQPVVLTNRITMDTYGNLHFANVIKADQLEPGAKYQCSANNEIQRKMVSGQDQVIIVSGDLIMGSPPSLMWATPDNRPIAILGSTFSLKCIFSGMPTPRVDWIRIKDQMGSHVTEDSFGQELVFKGVKFSDAGEYECNGWNTNAANPMRKPFLLSVESKPYWTKKPGSHMMGEHEDVTVMCEAAGEPKPTIKWFVNGVPVERAPPNPRRQASPYSITYTDLRLTDTEVIQCNASNIHGYIFANAYVTVLSVPPNWLVPPPPRIFFAESQTVNVTCQTQAAPRAHVVWTKDGVHLTGGRFHVFPDGNLQIEDLVATDAGRYECTASNRHGSISDYSEVFVRRATRIVRRPENLWVNAGTEAKMVCTATTDPENLNELVIEWLKDGDRINYALSQRLLQNNMDNSLTITGITILDTARYTCRARTSLDMAEASAQLKVRAPPQPPVVTHVDCVTKKKDLMAVVKFSPDGTNYAPIQGYIVQYNTSFTPDHWNTALEIVDDIKDTTVDVQMSAFNNYTFRVIARNRLGRSIPSLPSAQTCTTQPAPPSGNPIDVRVKGTTPTNLVITWTPMLPTEHNGLGFKYAVSWECVDEKCQKPATRDAYRGQTEISNYHQNMVVVENQMTYKRYRVVVAAENERGTSLVPAQPVYGYSGSNAPSVAPTEFHVDQPSIGATSAIIRWKPVPNDPRVIKGELKGYVVISRFGISQHIQRSVKMATFFFDHIEHTNATYIPTPVPQPTSAIPPTTEDVAAPPPGPRGPSRGDMADSPPEGVPGAPYTTKPPRKRRSVVSMNQDEMVVVVEDLPAYTEVEMTVAAVNEAFMGPESNAVTIQTTEGLPGPVGFLYSRRRLSNRIILAWDPPEEPNGVITGYIVAHVEVNGLDTGDWDWDPPITDPEVRMLSVSGLRPSQQYRFFVFATTAVGRGEANFIDLSTISAGMPSPPSFTVSEISDYWMNVTWKPSVTGNPGSVFYVQYKRTGRPKWESSRVETLHDWLNLTMLDAGTRYEVRVVARNGLDQEAASHIRVLTTSGYSARLDLILGHPWFICTLLLILAIGGVFCWAIYWRKNKPGRYPDTDKSALNREAGDVGEPMYIRNRAYEKSDSREASVGDHPSAAPPVYATVIKDERQRLRSATQTAEYGDTDYAPTEATRPYPDDESFHGAYAARDPDVEIIRPDDNQGTII